MGFPNMANCSHFYRMRAIDKARITGIPTQGVIMAFALCVIACLMPYFYQVGEPYLVISVVALLSCLTAYYRPVLLRSDLLLSGVLVYVMIVAFSHGSINSPITLWRWLAAGLAFYCGRLFINEPCIFAGVLIVPAFVQTIIVMLQQVGILQSLSFFFPVSGTFGNPAQAAVLIALGFAASLTIIKEKWTVLRHGGRITFIGLSSLFAIALLFCNTRSCLLSSIAVSVYLFFGYWFSKKKMLFTLLTVILFAVGLYFLRTESANVRLLIWQASWYLFEKHPVFGGGSTSFAAGYMLAQAIFFTKHPESPLVIFANEHNQPYNELIRLLCEQGVVGTMLIITLIILLAKKNGRLPLCMLSLLVIAFFYNVSDTLVLFLVFWMILGQMGNDNCFFSKNKKDWTWRILGGITAIVSFFFLLNSDHMPSKKWEVELLSYRSVCNEGDAFLSRGMHEYAEQRYQLANAMIPCRITAPYKLFKLYESYEPDKAIRWGRHVLDDMTFPVVNGHMLQMKADIRNGIDSLEHSLLITINSEKEL